MFVSQVALCCLIVCFDFCLAENAKYYHLFKSAKRDESSHQKESSESKSNETQKSDNFIKRSDLEELVNIKQRYILKNHMDDLETHFSLHFTPDWNQVNVYKSPARQNVEIRRQRWHFILTKMNESHAVQNLKWLLKEAGMQETQFCQDIAEAYFVLSDNAYIFDKDPSADTKRKHFQSVRDPLKQKSVKILTKIVSGSGLGKEWDKDEEVVQMPKSVYIDLIRKDAHIKILEQRNGKREKRIVDGYKKVLRKLRDENNIWVDSELPDSDISSSP